MVPAVESVPVVSSWAIDAAEAVATDWAKSETALTGLADFDAANGSLPESATGSRVTITCGTAATSGPRSSRATVTAPPISNAAATTIGIHRFERLAPGVGAPGVNTRRPGQGRR